MEAMFISWLRCRKNSIADQAATEVAVIDGPIEISSEQALTIGGQMETSSENGKLESVDLFDPNPETFASGRNDACNWRLTHVYSINGAPGERPTHTLQERGSEDGEDSGSKLVKCLA